MWMITSFLQILFPPQCLGCGKEAASLCRSCLTFCRKALSTPHSFIVSLFDFKDPLIKKAIHAGKYYHRKDLIPPLAEALAKLLRDYPHIETYTLVPVPMPQRRKLIRGYNQAEIIAENLSFLLKIPLRTDILVRRSAPARQVTMKKRKDRLTNQQGTFTLRRDVTGMHIMLVDDVATTGSTLSEARSVLLKNKAVFVNACTLAH